LSQQQGRGGPKEEEGDDDHRDDNVDGEYDAIDVSPDPRDYLLVYCWLMPTRSDRQRLYELVRQWGLHTEAV
jgi:hypothetical protein